MSDTECGVIRESLPALIGGRLAEADAIRVSAHLEACLDCRKEGELLRLLYATRPVVPAGLAPRIEAATRAPRRRASHPWWGLAAASVAAVALGIGVISRETPSPEESDLPGIVAGAEEAKLWVADDGLVAGAPAREGLTDEDLLMLLEEMGAETTGGAA
ncbi:MAG: zf-HC2 domain-containing protein [Gemmatimonadetes bacterium]|nr:zf-HC2 domain-containing protein [Gemmatimonadota bacterium]